MQDTNIKGTGNSYLIKSVADFLTKYPTYESMAAAFVAGTLPIDLALNAAGLNQQGTALNTANLLSAATGTKLGLASTATPNDALDALASHYGTCGTAAATKAKTVTLAGFKLATGSVIAVKFTYANTAASPTLNVNGTGAKNIAVYGTTAAGSGAWAAGEVVLFVYDGTRWVMNSGAVLGTGNNCVIYTGSYTGTGEDSVSLTFPKLPIYLIIGQYDVPSLQSGSNTFWRGFVVNDTYFYTNTGTRFAVMTTSGSTITFTKRAGNSYAGVPNSSDQMYRYIGFSV